MSNLAINDYCVISVIHQTSIKLVAQYKGHYINNVNQRESYMFHHRIIGDVGGMLTVSNEPNEPNEAMQL